jgi:RNA-directed DNA polymerase
MPRNLGFRSSKSSIDLQKLIILNLTHFSKGYLKRVLIVDLSKSLTQFNNHYLLRKIILPKSIKLGIFRCLTSGFKLSFDDKFTFSSLLSNIFFDGIEDIHSSVVRFGTEVLFFLRPFDDEKFLIKKIDSFLIVTGNGSHSKDVKLVSPISGFNFLDWNFKLFKGGNVSCTPSHGNYQNFLKRVKIIINNSNYGAV